ncbi:hypothetical protein [Senegalia massiliensis]|uniref:DUF8042 domain-containing protein n=1 Tax=Senegalia massiliensis TaxID=1720316 RepID=A0A845QZI6_9CLOT|nr:hypothetical protein [Senegalia massiliensis]NBI07364.1 hypothetical protein [Senegalia massiliensis]
MANNIINESLNSLNEYLDKLIPGIENIVDHFSKDNEGEALKLLIEAIEGINWCLEVVILTKPTLEKYNIEINEKNIRKILLEFEQALQNEDFVYVSDLLEYELIDIFKYWKKEISNISFVVN